MTVTDLSAETLAASWQVFREHHPVGAYLPVGQMDGDCKTCHVPWPCAPVRALLAEGGEA